MREILFRGKQKVGNKDWVEGYYAPISLSEEHGPQMAIVTLNPNDYAYLGYGGSLASPSFHMIDPSTVCQFTGMLDKNGKKIFEGDIVRAMTDWGPGGMFESVVTIRYSIDDGYGWGFFDLDTIEVIGNIYDNPELLEVK